MVSHHEPHFFIRGSHKMATEMVSVTLRGESKKGKKNLGVGGGEIHCRNWKVFIHHTGMAIENLSITTQSPYAGGDQNFLIAMGAW
jgi:hypothetical protein